MKLAVDTHTHTYASGHAYSTLIENARAAKQNGLTLFCTLIMPSLCPERRIIGFSLTSAFCPVFWRALA